MIVLHEFPFRGFIATHVYKTSSHKKICLHSFIYCILFLTTVARALSQTDTTKVDKYMVNGKSGATATGISGAIISPVPPGGGCSLSGSGTVAGGSIASYTLTCSEGGFADYWEVTCGTSLQSFQDEITIQWNSSGCTSGTIRARKNEGIILATKTVTITAQPPPSIAYTPLYTSSNFTKTIDLSKPVGTVAGAAGTTPSGGVTWSFPIYTPPGTNGMQPSVSVSYNSQAGSGIAGWGWNITGLSAISRTGKNIYHNGIVNPVTYTSNDAFLLDGMRLNAISGTNGANGTVYAGEAESFAKIASVTGTSANNPDWFQVTAKDGSIMEFGHTTDSRILTDNGVNVMLWRLNRILDINGNYIDFVYDNGGRDSRIKTIKYTGNINGELTPNNSVTFNYKLRADKNNGYDAGASLSSQYLLDKITIVTDGDNITKNYQFNYGFDNVSSYLKEVIEFAGTGTSLNSTIFLYGNQPQNLTVVPATNTNVLQGPNDLFTGDFDADGKTDIIAAAKYYNNGYRFHTKLEAFCDLSSGSPYLLYSQEFESEKALYYYSYRNQRNFLVSDYNKDGRDDIMLSYGTAKGISASETAFELNGFRINYSGTTTSSGPRAYLPPEISYPSGEYRYSKNGKYLTSGDFDGDGNQDYILTLSQYPTANNSTWVYNYKNFFSSPSTNEFNQEILEVGDTKVDGNASDVFHMIRADYVMPMDFDGDGKQELLVTSGNMSGIISFQRISVTTGYSFAEDVIYNTSLIKNGFKIFPGDFNGDRKTDFLVKNTSGVWNILYSTGTSFISAPFSFNQAVNITGSYSDHLLLISDFNGDGKSDILHGFPVWINGTASTSKLSFYFSRGYSASSFFYEQYDYGRILASSPDGISEGIAVGDFNGDGRSDIINKPSVSLNEDIDLLTIKQFGKERLLVKVTDGHNTTTAFDYKLLTDKSTYPYFYDRTVSLDDAANKNPYNYVQLPLYAVSSVSVPDGIGGTKTTNFTYENAVVHRSAKGFLGFKKVTAKDMASGITSITENEVNTQFAVTYPVKQATKLTAANQVLTEAYITASFDNLSTGNGDIRYLQKTDKMLNIDYLNNSASEIVNTFDEYYNVTKSISKTGTFSGTTVTPIETSTTTAAYSIHNTPVPSKPDNITVSNLRTGGSALSSTTTYTYTAAGLQASQTVFSGLPKAVKTTYTYNNFGNPLTAVTSSTGLGNRTVTNTYDTRGRFVISKQVSGNNVSQTDSYTYDEQWGKPLSQTTGDCLTTSFEYDAFGRLKKTTLPQGFALSNSLTWDVSGNNVYYTFTDYPGGNPDVKIWYDKLGRETKTQTAGFDNKWTTRLTTYNAKGQVASQTNDYYTSETPLTTVNTYDAYGRLVTAANTLNTVTTAYSIRSDGTVRINTSNAGGQGSSSKNIDAAGRVVATYDKGGKLNFTYDSRGRQTYVKMGQTTLVTLAKSTYDSYGRQTGLTDKNAGTVTYTYDAYGQLTKQTDAKGSTYTIMYDDLGRITSRTGPEGVTTYEYYKDIVTGCSNNSLTKVTGYNGVIKEYTYDAYKRPATEKVTIDGTAYITSFSYNQYNDLTKTVYPSGIEENTTYDANGTLLTVTGGNPGSPITLFTASAVNGFGQYTAYTTGNGKTAQNSYYFGVPTRYYTAGVQDLNLTFDYTTGNLTSRRDAVKNITENFTFDNLNRLTSATVNGVQQFAIGYDGDATNTYGNIVSKTDAGNYVYKTDKINAVAYITNPAGTQTPPAVISTWQQLINYTPFQKTAAIDQNGYHLDYTYGADMERIKSVITHIGPVVETKYYFGAMEVQTKGGATRYIHYINAGNGLCAILVKEGGTVSPYYVYTDHLGSLLTVTDAAGTVVAEQNFDAWGRKRNPVNWQYAGVPASLDWLYRGYTGHEHLPDFDLINMNGRMYDPIQGRMLSPDNYVADPFGTQGYNRYSYANNNPLSYVDPDGNHPLLIAAAIGATIGAFTGGMQAILQRKSFLEGAWKGALVGGIGGGLSGALSGAFSSWGLVGSGIANGAITGFATGGLGSALNGASVSNGALSGALWGAAIGGAMGALNGLTTETADFELPVDRQTGEYFQSKDELDNFINSKIGNVSKIQSNLRTDISLANENNLPEGPYSFKNNYIYKLQKGKLILIGGSTESVNISGLKSRIFISPGIRGSYYSGINVSQMTINHELLHAYHLSLGLPFSIYNAKSEQATTAYSLAYAKAYNMTTLIGKYGTALIAYSTSYYPASYSWRNLTGTLNLGIR